MKKYRSAVSVVVVRNDPDGSRKILLVHKPRKSDVWQLPQGGIEEGETAEVAALRELREETGLDLKGPVTKSALKYSYDFPQEFIDRHKPVNAGQKLCFVVTEAPVDVVVTVDRHEIDDFRWVTVEELPRFNPRKEYREVIGKVLAETVRYVL